MSDEHQDWSHRSPPISPWWFCSFPTPELAEDSSLNGGDDDDDDASSSEIDDEMVASQWFTFCHS